MEQRKISILSLDELKDRKPPEYLIARVIPEAVHINNRENLHALCINLVAHSEENGAIGLLIIDTLNRNLEGDENAAKGMFNFIRGCTEIINFLGCAILILHHPSKGGTGGTRGHSALNGATDIGLEIKNGKKDIFTVKMDAKPPKDDEPAPDLTLKAKIIDLSEQYGLDTTGAPITSLVLEKVESKTEFLPRTPKAKTIQQRVWSA